MLLAMPAAAVSNVIHELIPFITADGGASDPQGSGEIFGQVIEGNTAYIQLDNASPQITRIDDVSGTQGVTRLVSRTDWLLATGKTILMSFYGFSVWSNYLQFADVSSDEIWRVNKYTGEVMCYADKTAITNATGRADGVQLLCYQGINRFTGEQLFYEGKSDSILITVGSNVVEVYISSDEMITAFGSDLITGGMTYDPDRNFYWFGKDDDAMHMRATNGDLSVALAKSEIALVTSEDPRAFGDVFCAPDGWIYFRVTCVSDAVSVLRCRPHDPPGTLEIHLSESDLTNSIAESSNVTSLSWYDNGFTAGITWHNMNGRHPVYWAEHIPGPTDIPLTPTGVAASDCAYPRKVRVNWNPRAGATKYMVYRNTVGDTNGAMDISGEVVTNSFDDTNATPSVIYHYWVRAGNSNGWSGFSASDSGYYIPIDGTDIVADFAGSPWHTYQTTNDDWGGGAQAMAMYVNTNATHLLIGIPSFLLDPTYGRSLVVFVDGDPGKGANVIPAGLTQTERVKNMAGMSFDTEFAPDRAVTLGLSVGATTGYPNIEIFVADTTHSMGVMSDPHLGPVTATNDSSATMIGAFMNTTYAMSQTNTADNGVEIALAYEDVGNSSLTVKLMAVVTDFDAANANNQSLPPCGGNPNWVSGPSSDHHADLVPGSQFLTVILPVSGAGVQPEVTAGKDKACAFAASTEIDFTSSASSGTPPYSYSWALGNGAKTNTQNFSYTYPLDGDFDVLACVSDCGGHYVTADVGTIRVYAETTVDGLNITNDFAGKDGTNVLQDTSSNWGEATAAGNGAQLDALYAYCEGRRLYIGVCGNLTTNTGNRVLGVFIDSDYSVGGNVMPAITNGSPAKLLNLQGMTFDSDFTPDKAVLLSIDQPDDCWVDVYHINSSSEWSWSTKTESTSIFSPDFQRIVNDRYGLAGDVVAFNDSNTSASPQDADTGFECYLDYDTVYEGLTPDPGQDTVRIQAILYDYSTNGDNVANQSLPGINGNSSGYGNASDVNYNYVSGLQYIEVCAPVPEPGLFVIACLAAIWSAFISRNPAKRDS